MLPNNTTNGVKLCQCGCGQPAPIATKTRTERGQVKGQSLQFIPGHTPRITLEDRFWEKVNKTGSCWLWTGRKDRNGYGYISVGKKGTLRAHRVSWTIHHGTIPDGLFALHRCDANYLIGDTSYRLCVNPAHLWLGTQKDNMRDMYDKGRRVNTPQMGESHGMSKLTEAQVLAIRAEYADAVMKQRKLAIKYGIGRTTIQHIIHRRTWTHI